jgi:hypothetical protein
MQHTATQPKITIITQTHQSVFKRSIYITALAALGGITALAGIVGLISAITLLSNAALPTLSHTMLRDAVVDVTTGGLIFSSSRVFAKGKIMAIWLYVSSILLDTLYSLIMGYPLHYIFIGLGGLLIWYMLKFRKEWVTR